jgi:hypothetical protein
MGIRPDRLFRDRLSQIALEGSVSMTADLWLKRSGRNVMQESTPRTALLACAFLLKSGL